VALGEGGKIIQEFGRENWGSSAEVKKSVAYGFWLFIKKSAPCCQQDSN